MHRLVQRGYVRDGKFYPETDYDRLWRKINKHARKQELVPSKHKCPNCGIKMGIYGIEENDTHVQYSCIGCGKRFRKKEFNSDGGRINP